MKALAALDPSELDALFRSALRSAGRPIATEMEKLAPVGDTGELRDSIMVQVYKVVNTATGKGNVHARVRIGPSAKAGRKGGRYAHLVELGTKGGKRITRKRKFQIFGGGEVVETREINHPGQRPQPFIRTAFDNKYAAANRKIRDRLLKKFDEILRTHLK
jgi:HK97 gp10 family phage protein